MASCDFVDRTRGSEKRNDPRNHTNGHEARVKNGKWKMIWSPHSRLGTKHQRSTAACGLNVTRCQREKVLINSLRTLT